MNITPNLVRIAAPACREPEKAAAALNAACTRHGVTSRLALLGLLAQLGHESELNPGEENLNYTAARLTQVWPNRFPSLTSAQPFASNPQALANRVYGGRMGNTAPGDGYRYRGRGYIQITGRDMYRALGFESNPEALLNHEASAEAALAFLKRKGLLDDLERGDVDAVSYGINGGWNGIEDRRARFARLLAAMPAQPVQRFLLVPMGGGDPAEWNGRDNPYGGHTLGPELLSDFDLTYPQPGGPWEYGTVKVWRRRDGTFVLERIKK